MLKVSRILRATTGPGIEGFESRPRMPRPPKNPLLAPIPLFRKILRIHRKLPNELRVIGDPYVKSEFKLHSTTDNPMHIVGFLSEWQKYAQDLGTDSWKGAKIDKGKIDKMSDEQLRQLYDLMQATKDTSDERRDIEETNELIDKITQH